jgi:hypothetical protein
MRTLALAVESQLRENYLNSEFGIHSWLFTTDHERIALLYLVSITFFFALGGTSATLIRIHLLTPAGFLVSPDTYNRLFTMHGVVIALMYSPCCSRLCERLPGSPLPEFCSSFQHIVRLLLS